MGLLKLIRRIDFKLGDLGCFLILGVLFLVSGLGVLLSLFTYFSNEDLLLVTPKFLTGIGMVLLGVIIIIGGLRNRKDDEK
tara:strand:+ start:136 stop:378 length:243 start_codon:yes stop_codon:yes gene_type:complete